jgi:putative nucleotide binding protein
MEDFAYILDYLPKGRPDDPRKKDPVAYGVGEKNFVVLELAPKPNATLLVGDRVGLNREPDSPIDHVRARVRMEEMTHAAQSELPFVVEQMVKLQEERFVKFFNDAGPITTRMHMLELLPGLGKKLMWANNLLAGPERRS